MSETLLVLWWQAARNSGASVLKNNRNFRSLRPRSHQWVHSVGERNIGTLGIPWACFSSSARENFVWQLMVFHGTQGLSAFNPYRATDGAGGTHIPLWVLHRKVLHSPMDRPKMPELKLGPEPGSPDWHKATGSPTHSKSVQKNISSVCQFSPPWLCHIPWSLSCSRPPVLPEVWRKCPVSQQWTKETILLVNFTVIFVCLCLPFCLPSPTQPLHN